MSAIGLSAPRLTRSEWTKFRTLRSTWWTLAVGVVLMFGAALIGATNTAHNTADATAADVVQSTQFGVVFAELVVLVLGALFVTGEYGTGMIRSTLTVVPRRVPALLAKAGVLAAVVLPVGLVTAVVSFLVGDALWRVDGRGGASLADGAVLESVVGSGLYLGLGAVFALAVGTLVRSTAGAVAILMGLFFVVPAMAGTLPGLGAAAPYLPSNAGAVLSGAALSERSVNGWVGIALFAGYTAVVLVAAAVRLRRTDG